MKCACWGRNLIKPGVCRVLPFLIVEYDGERPSACSGALTNRLLQGIRVHDVEHLLRLRIILIILELPALHYRAAIRDFHAVEIVFDDDAAFLRIVFYCDACGRRSCHCCRRRSGLRWIRRRRRRTRRGGGSERPASWFGPPVPAPSAPQSFPPAEEP